MLRNITSLLFRYLTTEQREKLYIEEYKSFQCFTFSITISLPRIYIYIYFICTKARYEDSTKRFFNKKRGIRLFEQKFENSFSVFISYHFSHLIRT